MRIKSQVLIIMSLNLGTQSRFSQQQPIICTDYIIIYTCLLLLFITVICQKCLYTQ